ncbi:MAG TPA: Mur ligase family protein [Bacteroidales bacterium]|nr:Mur ligase family protein [Bacteroidales bacterium]
MRVHFIAIGGAVMHNLAIALHLKGDKISGSDDSIFEPSRSNLARYGLLPLTEGWDPDRIIPSLDAVILGMHAREDNPELLRARELGIRIYSFPEFLYQQFRQKTRVVIAGSHGKTTITAMVLHVLQSAGLDPDYMVGAKLDGFDVMVRITDGPGIAVLEGDEYLTSPLDPRPKFLHYHPDIALVTGIAWDHINVFPTEQEYFNQFQLLMDGLAPGGSLVYCDSDPLVARLPDFLAEGQRAYSYSALPASVEEGQTILRTVHGDFILKVFGRHNLENIAGAARVCQILGVDDHQFFSAISTFPGAARRLEKVASRGNSILFRDFAHAPSKLRSTVTAVREQYPEHRLIACFELHTFSSLNLDFLPQYGGCLDKADAAAVFYHPDTLRLKRLPAFGPAEVRAAFQRDDISVIHEAGQLLWWLQGLDNGPSIILLMSSGDFHGLKLGELIETLGYDSE